MTATMTPRESIEIVCAGKSSPCHIKGELYAVKHLPHPYSQSVRYLLGECDFSRVSMNSRHPLPMKTFPDVLASHADPRTTQRFANRQGR